MTRCLLVTLLVGSTFGNGCEGGPEDVAEGRAEAQQDGVQLLELVPADAPMALIIPNLRQLSDDIGALAEGQSLGVPQVMDLLGTVRALAGIREGLREDGTAVAVVTDAQALTTGTSQPFVVLVPVTDYEDFVGNYQPNRGDLTELTLPGGLRAFSRPFGAFAAVGVDRGTVASFRPAEESSLWSGVGVLEEAALAKSGATLIVNLDALAPLLRPLLSQTFAQMAEFYRASGDTSMDEIWPLYARAWDVVLRDGTHVVWGLDVAAEGVGMTWTVRFREGSFMARLLPGGGDARALWSDLPNRDYVLAGVTDLSGVDFDLLLEAMDGVAGEQPGFLTLMRNSMEMYRGAEALSTAWYAGQRSDSLEEEPELTVLSILHTSDSTAALERFADATRQLNGVSLPMAGVPTPELGAVVAPAHATTEYEAGVLHVGAARVDRYRIETGLPAEIMEAMGPTAEILAAMGITDQEGYAAAVPDGRLVMVTQADEALLRTVLEPGETLAGRAELEALRQHALIEQPSFEMVVDVSTTADWVLTHLSGAPAPAALLGTDDVPQAVFYGYVVDRAAALRAFVPGPVIGVLARLGG